MSAKLKAIDAQLAAIRSERDKLSEAFYKADAKLEAKRDKLYAKRDALFVVCAACTGYGWVRTATVNPISGRSRATCKACDGERRFLK